MRFVLPYVYAEQISKKQSGRTVSHQYLCTDYVSADAPEIDRSDYSKVAEWTENRYGTTVTKTCISFRDELYFPLMTGGGQPVSPPLWGARENSSNALWIDDLLGLDSGSRESNLILDALHSGKTHEKRRGLGNLVRADHDTAQAIATEAAQGIIYATGLAWKRIPSLTIVSHLVAEVELFIIQPGPVGFNVPTRRYDQGVLEPPHFERRFAINEEHVARERTGQRPFTRQYAALKLFGAAPAFDGDADYARRTAQYILNQTYETVGNMGLSAATDWLCLRDIYQADEYGTDEVERLHALGENLLSEIPDDAARYYAEMAVERLREQMDHGPTATASSPHL